MTRLENDKKQVKGLKEEFKVGVDSVICIEVLKYIIKDVYSSIHHELHEHILQHDEDSWNLEYYTNGKLDYRKLLIGLLSDYENRLSKGIDKYNE